MPRRAAEVGAMVAVLGLNVAAGVLSVPEGYTAERSWPRSAWPWGARRSTKVRPPAP